MGGMPFPVTLLNRQEGSVFGWGLCLQEKGDCRDIIVIDSHSMLDQLKADTSDISDLYTRKIYFCPLILVKHQYKILHINQKYISTQKAVLRIIL